MSIFNGFFLKGATSIITTLTGWATIYFTNEYFDNQLTKYDRGLMNFLEKEGKVKFKVEKIEFDGRTEVITKFPKFVSGDITPMILRVSVSTSQSAAQLFDSDNPNGEGGKREKLRKLNGGEQAPDWTWNCTIKFHRFGSNVNDANELIAHQREVLKKESQGGSDGFFDKLSDKEGNRDLKIKFIRECAHMRTVKINRMINGASDLSSDGFSVTVPNQIDSKKDFLLVEVKNHSDPSNRLIFKYWREFDR